MAPARPVESTEASTRFVLLGVLALLVPVAAAAQVGCEFQDGTRSFEMRTLSGGATVTYLGGPIMACADGVRIRADSAVSYSAQGMEHLMGNVVFVDRNGELNADEVRYFPDQGRVQAEGNLFVRNTVEGYTIENGRMIYLRPTEFREEAQVDVRNGIDGRRPRAVVTMRPAERPDLAPPDSLAVSEPSDATPPSSNSPYTVDGDRILIHGDTYFRATGDVEIHRDSLHAFADSAEYDQVAGRMFLQGSARVEGTAYDLRGEVINLGMAGNDIDEVVAREDAVLTGEGIRLTAPEIRMYMDAGVVDRLVAVMTEEAWNAEDPSLRPRAVSDRFDLTADSLDFLAPREVLERIFASGAARSVSSSGDSLNVDVLPELARTDWLEGDTVVVTFLPPDSAPAADSAATARYRIDRIVARVGARSLYRLPPADSNAVPGVDPPAVHYVVGNQITIVMLGGEVDGMEVLGQTRGVHLEPLQRNAAPDSLPLDSAAVDTATARDTTRAATRPASRGPEREAPEPTIPDDRPHTREPAAKMEGAREQS